MLGLEPGANVTECKYAYHCANSGKLCRHDNGGAEDVEMGKCLQNLGVVAGDSRDENGGPRFFALSPGSLTILV